MEAGLIGPLGFVDPTVGGDSHRYSLSFDLRGEQGERHWNVAGFALDYELDLFSNFTYFLEDPLAGDQFEQFDDRRVYGLDGHYHWPLTNARFPGDLELGMQVRHDDIGTVGLYRTAARARLGTVREDTVDQTSFALYASSRQEWSSVFRSVLGLRVDHFRFDVDSDLALNSGSESDTMVSPKLSLIFGPWQDTEYFINIGRGFHSNDARGTTIRVDPVDGMTPVDPVDPLVEALGVDLGVRSARLRDVQLAASLWALRLDSELVFVGDGGATEPSGKSERYGAELGVFYTPTDWLIVDADLAYAHARFDDDSAGGDRIPGAVERTASLGLTFDPDRKWSGGLRVRHFGEAPLVEDGSVRSDSTTVVNGKLSYRFSDTLSLTLEGFNLLDSDDNDITYFYESRLPGESMGMADVHFHPVEPRNFRLGISVRL